MLSDEECIAILIGLVAVAFVLWRFPEWIRAAKEDRERLIAWSREHESKMWYRDIPARLDKWQQERSERSLDQMLDRDHQRWEEWASNRLK